LAEYFCRFIKEFSKIAKSLTNLLKKETDFNGGDKEQESFTILKNALCEEPVLQYPDFTKPLFLTTNASGTAIGAILSHGQVGKERIQSRSTSLKEDCKKLSLVNDAIRIAKRELSNEDQIRVQQHPYLQENIFTIIKEAYLNSLEKMTALLENKATSSDNSTSGQIALQVSTIVPYFYQSRLSRIDLPKFDGTPSEWLSFKDLFNSLMTANYSVRCGKTPISENEYY